VVGVGDKRLACHGAGKAPDHARHTALDCCSGHPFLMIDGSSDLLHPIRRKPIGDRAGDGHERHWERHGENRKTPRLGGRQQAVWYPIV
jgi:hypothetical protein